jgi:hypothetical protein
MSFCVHGDNPLGSIIRQVLGKLNKYQLFKEDLIYVCEIGSVAILCMMFGGSLSLFGQDIIDPTDSQSAPHCPYKETYYMRNTISFVGRAAALAE